MFGMWTYELLKELKGVGRVEWDKLIETTKNALIELFAEESEELSKDVARIGLIAGDIVGYQRLKMSGNEEDERNATRILKHLVAEARVVAALYEVKARRIVSMKVELMARTGLALLKAGVEDVL